MSHGRNTRALVPGQRDMNVTMSVGVGDSFVEEPCCLVIDYLRNALQIKQAGATILDGLQGHIFDTKSPVFRRRIFYRRPIRSSRAIF